MYITVAEKYVTCIYIYTYIHTYAYTEEKVGRMDRRISVFLTSWSSRDLLNPAEEDEDEEEEDEEEDEEEKEEEEGAIAGILERLAAFILSPSLSIPLSSSSILDRVTASLSLLILLPSTQLPPLLLLLLLLLSPPITTSLACKTEMKFSRSLRSLLNALSQKSSDVTIAGNSKSGHKIIPLPFLELKIPVPVLLPEPGPEVHRVPV